MNSFKIMAVFLGVAFSSSFVVANPSALNNTQIDAVRVLPELTQVAAKKATESAGAERALKSAAERLKKDPDFRNAIAKKDKRTIARMLKKASGIDAPLKIKLSGEGKDAEFTVIIHIECHYPPLACHIDISVSI